jgi:two-component system cell cycle sensor histidine kinase/response regulator CckA
MKELLVIDSYVKVIVSSGYSSDPIMSDYKQYGFRDVIVKPYKIEELEEVIERVIAED